MKTQEFLSLLGQHQNKSLLFEYQSGFLVGANYHITEVKNSRIDSVDCGARTDSWDETIVQLWESPKEKEKTEYLSAYKTLGILNKVNGLKPMEPNAEIKFEYGNPTFNTAQLFVKDSVVKEDVLLIRLAIEKTDCKAKEECGVPVAAGATAEACCSAESGCC